MFAEDLWLCATKVPPLYPNLVTLGGTAAEQQAVQREAIDLLRSLDLSPNWAVKDSFRSLDLAPHGYELLFEASWLARDPDTQTPRSPDDVLVVRDAAGLAAWEDAWRRDQANEADTLPPRLFRDALLGNADVAFLALRRDGRIVAGAAANRAAGVAGLTNLFIRGVPTDTAASTLVAAISARFPGLPIVDYETEDRARELKRVGFRAIGPLAVWLAG